MKKSILILLVSVLTVIFTISTSAAQAQTMARDDVKNMVVKAIAYPEAAIDKQLQGDVIVSFSPNQQGRLEVMEIFSRIPILQKYVYEKITALQLPAPVDAFSDPIVLRFSFKLI